VPSFLLVPLDKVALRRQLRRTAQKAYLAARPWFDAITEIRAGDPAAAEFAAFGEGSRIVHPCVALVNPRAASIGDNTYIRSYFCLEAYAAAGDVNVRIRDGVQLGHNVRVVAFNGIELEDLVGIGHGCTLADSVHDWKSVEEDEGRALWDTPAKLGRTLLIRTGAFLGNNCIVQGGITIGEWSVVDHGTIVNKDVPPRTIVGGYPARVLRVRREDGSWNVLEDPPLLQDYESIPT
jgi:acetyltransferase-like isoleucine patch superfamily enzyme